MSRSPTPPFFSVVIPTYNRADTISIAINSVLQQGFTQFEIIIIDDGSNDDTERRVREFQQENIVYLRCEHFGGPARARNIGIKAARGNWICFLDSDDWWYSDKLECAYRVITNEEVDLIYHPMNVVNTVSSKKIRTTAVRSLRTPVRKSILINLHKFIIPNSSVVVRKQLLKQIGYISEDRELIALEDFDTWSRLAEVTDKFRLVDRPLGAYGVGGQRLTRYDLSRVAALKKIVTARLSNINWPGTELEKAKIIAFLDYQYGRVNQNSGRFTEACEKYCKSLQQGGPIRVQLLATLGWLSSKLKMRL